MASEYDRKFEEMKHYIPFLESMIKRLENSSGSTNPRQAQLDKIRSLRDLLLDKKKRMKMENLLKCEQVLVNLYAKVEQRDTLPGIDLKMPSPIIKIKEEPDLDVVRNKLKIVSKMQEELPDTLPEIARANESRDTSTSGAKEPALFQRRPNISGPSESKNSQPKRNYTRVLVSPEPSPQRWSKQDDKTSEKPLFSRRSPRRQSPTYRKDKKQSKQNNSSKSNLNITLKVPEESLDSLNTSDIFSRIINCSDTDVDIATLRELRSQILGELKHTGAKDDISDLILSSTKKKKKKKSHKPKEDVEEGELSDSESEAIENIYGSLVILDKDQNSSGQKSNKQEQKPRKIQIRLVINSENEAADEPSTSEKKGLVPDPSDVCELEMFDTNKGKEFIAKPAEEVSTLAKKSDEKVNIYDDDIAPKASDLPDDGSANIIEPLPKNEASVVAVCKPINESNLSDVDKNTEDKKKIDKKVDVDTTFKPNFYKPLIENETGNKESKVATDIISAENKDISSSSNNKESVLSEDINSKDKDIDKASKVIEEPKKDSADVDIPLLNEPSVASQKPKENIVSEIDILQALKNEILSDTIAIPVTEQATPALHQPKLTKVANTQEIEPKKRISIEKYKQKAKQKPAKQPLFTSQSSLKDDLSKKQSLKLTEKEYERFKIALDNELSSDDDDIFDDLNKSDDDECTNSAPKSPDNDESSNIGANNPVIIPVDPVKNVIASSKTDVDMRNLVPLLSPVAAGSQLIKDIPKKDSVIESSKSISKPEINRPSDPRLKRDSTSTNFRNDSIKPVPPPLVGFPNIATSAAVGTALNLVPPVTPNPNMTPSISANMTPNRAPNMTPNWVPNMTPSMTPNSRAFEIDDQPKRKHVYASLYDTGDNSEDTQRPYWESETNDERERSRDRTPHNQGAQNYKRYNDSRSFYNNNRDDARLDSQMPMYRRTDAPMTPSHPFGRSECPPTPSHSFGRAECPPTPGHPFGRAECPPTPGHPFGRSECPPTPGHPFGRSECPPTPGHPFGRSECPATPSHPFGRLDCPATPNHPFGRSEGPTSSHSFGRSECPPTPSHPFGRSDCPTTPSHPFGRSECPTTPSHPFGRSEMPLTPSHPFGRVDPRLQKTNESIYHNDDRNRRYYNDQSSHKNFQPYNPVHDLNSKTNNADNYRKREQSVSRNERSRHNYYEPHNNEERISRHERNYDNDQYNVRSRRSDTDYYPNDNRSRFESRSSYQRERSVGRTNSMDERQVRSNSRARSVGRNNEREDENCVVKPNVGRSFTIDTSVNSTFQNVVKNSKEKSIFDQLFDRNNRASSVGRSFIRESSVGRTLSRPLNSNDNKNVDNPNDRFRRARSVVRDTNDNKTLSEVKADFESYRTKTNILPNKGHSSNIQAVDRNSPRTTKYNETDNKKKNDSKSPYSPRKNNRDPRLNRDSYYESRGKQKDDRYRYDARDKKKHGIIYSNDNIASGAILGSGYGVKNYKIPKIKRVEEPPVTQTTEKIDQTKEQNKRDKSTVTVDKVKTDKSNKPKVKENSEKGNKMIGSNKSVDNIDKKGKSSNKKEESKVDHDDVIVRPRRSRRLIKDSDDSDDSTTKDKSSSKFPEKLTVKMKLMKEDDNSCETEKETEKLTVKMNLMQEDDNSRETEKESGFGIEDLDSSDLVSDQVIDKIDSLIAHLDDDIKTSNNTIGNKYTNDISLENMLDNISSHSETEQPTDITIDKALQEIDMLIGSDKREIITSEKEKTQSAIIENIPLSIIKNDSSDKQIKEREETQTAYCTDKVEEKRSDIERETTKNDFTQIVKLPETKELNENITNDKTDVDISQSFKQCDAIVSTTESTTDELNVQSQNDEPVIRSTTPDSTNADTLPKESTPSKTMPDSTDEVHTEVSEVSSSNNSAPLTKESEPNTLNKEVSATSDPLGNILSILQSKSKLKELLSMLGDQSSDNDKIKKKLEKLSEIVSDEEDTRDDAEQHSTIGVEQESRDGTEIEEKNEKESKDESQKEQDLSKESHETTEDESISNLKDSSEVPEVNTETVVKRNTVKKVPVKKGKITKKRNLSLKTPVEEKRVTRSDINQQKLAPAKKKMSRELLKLQEDIKEMFISDDVLNVTGIRMCRLAKLVDENNQKDVSTKSDTEPVVVLEKITKADTNEGKTVSARKKPGPKSKVNVEAPRDVDEKTEKSKTLPKYRPGPKSKTKSQTTSHDRDVDPYDFETDSINESNASKISEGSVHDSFESDSESLTSFTSFESSEALSELKPLSELKKKPKRKKSSWKAGVIKPKNKKKKLEQKLAEPLPKGQTMDDAINVPIPDANCFIDKQYCFTKNVFSYSCRLCVFSGEDIVAHYKKEHPHTEIPLSRMSPEVAKEAIEQCEIKNFQIISKIPTDKYTCRFCFKEFGKKKSSLESFFWHVVSMHTGEYKQICSECVNITSCPFNLDIPTPPKDTQGQLLGYVCEKCNFTQISLENIKTHVIVRHNVEQTEVYTVSLAVMSKKLLNLLSKRVSLPEADQPRVLRSSRSNYSMTDMSDDRSDATESNSFVAEPDTKEKEEIEVKDIRKLSIENKSKLQSKITFETDDSASETNSPVKIKREESDEEMTNTAVEVRKDTTSEVLLPHFKVNYIDNVTGLELMCFVNDNQCHFRSSTMKSFKSHVSLKHRDQIWNGYCIDCKSFVNSHGKHSFRDCLSHFEEKHMDRSKSESTFLNVHFKIILSSELGIQQFVCSVEGLEHYLCSTLEDLKEHVITHNGKWFGYCTECKDFVKPRGEYSHLDCLSHYTTDHNICELSVSEPITESDIVHENQDDLSPSDIFAYPHFKITYTETGSKEFVCCILQKEGIHYKTPLLISLKKHIQTKHSEDWDGYCFVCKVIVMPQGRHKFKDCLQHFLDKHVDDFPVLEKEVEPEKPIEEAAPPSAPKNYINVRPLSELKRFDVEETLVLPKIESVISLGAPAAAPDCSSPPEEEVNEPPPEPEPEPEPQPDEEEEFTNYEATQMKVMSQKHPVVQEAMLRKEKLVKIYKCAGSYCSFATDSADMALSHALTHQKIGGENALCCSYCDFDCSGNAIDLVVHVFKHSSCPFACGYCFYRGAAPQSVEGHSASAHPGKQAKVYFTANATIPQTNDSKMLSREAVVQYYVCNHEEFAERCMFKTFIAEKLVEHQVGQHSGPTSCYICSEGPLTPDDLIEHMKSHGLNKYQCTWCIHGSDTESELVIHAASVHPTHPPKAYVRIIKDGLRVLPLVCMAKGKAVVEQVPASAHPENPVKEAERSIDLQKLIGQTKLMFENITSSNDPKEESNPPTVDDMATISPTNKTPPRTDTPPQMSEQPTPILKSEPVEITPAKSDDIVCLDSDEETSEDRSETSTALPDMSTEEDVSNTTSIGQDEVFKCPKCLHCCKNDIGLKLHILKCYNPNWPMACPHCHKMTVNREDLVQHYLTDHCKKYVCKYCSSEMTSLKNAKSHMKVLHKITKVNVVYGSGKNNHMVEKDDSVAPKPTPPKSYGPAKPAPPKRKLSMTNAGAPPAKQMKRYGPQDVDQLPINPILDELVYCSLCEFNTKVRLNMVRHLQLHAEQQPAPQTAPVNPVPHLETNEMHFDKMVNLASSSLAKEKTKEVGPIVSQIPPEAAARYPKYVPERQRYTCGAKDCSYTSVDETMLRCHWETLHSGTTDYRCVHCPPYQHLDKSKPLIASRIMLHLKMHDTSLYACSSCTYYYFKKPVVEKHINDTHKGNGHVMVVREEASGPIIPATSSAPTMDLKPWQCGLCKFKSMLRPEVTEHCSKLHQSKMQYKCAYCPFRTSNLENVSKHQLKSHPGRPEDVFYYYYREGSVNDEDGMSKWMKQRQKMGLEDAVVKTESPREQESVKTDPPPVVPGVDLNIVKKEVEEKAGEFSVEELCRKFGSFCEPNGLRYKCCLCTSVTEDSKESMQSHLYEELQYRKWRCSICSYKAFHKNGLHEHILTEHRGRMQEPLPINLPVDENIERWVAELLKYQTTIIEKNKQNLLVQKVQTPGPSGLNAPQKVPEKPKEPVRTNFTQKEMEDAFGTFGVSNNKEYSCPKCVFRTEKEESMREHLESELTKIRWCCSVCADYFQTYHETLTHCKSKHDGQTARPKEAIRDPHLRSSWVATCLNTQKKQILISESSRNSKIGAQKSNEASKYNLKELEDAFGQFGVANNKQFSCPKCVFRTNSEDDMKEHLESELTRIRWSCSNCVEKFQTYHEAQFHCKSHATLARPVEALRDVTMRQAWLATLIHTQKQAMNTNDNDSPEKSNTEPDNSLLVVRYEENVTLPEPSTSTPRTEPKEVSESPESDDEKLVIDEKYSPKKIGNVIVCPHCPFESKHKVAVKEHVYRHYGLTPFGCGYCDVRGYRATILNHLETDHKDQPKKLVPTLLPKGKPTILKLKTRRGRRKNQSSDLRFCLLCQVTFTAELAEKHTHGQEPSIFVKHGDIVINCKLCQTFKKEESLMEQHYASIHPHEPLNYLVYQIQYHPNSKKSMLPVFKRILHLPSEPIDLNEDEDSPPRKVARKSTTKLPMQAIAKKSTTKLPYFYISEEEEYSFYGTKPTPLESYENVTTLMAFGNTMVPFTVKKVSEILQISPKVVVKDCKK